MLTKSALKKSKIFSSESFSQHGVSCNKINSFVNSIKISTYKVSSPMSKTLQKRESQIFMIVHSLYCKHQENASQYI